MTVDERLRLVRKALVVVGVWYALTQALRRLWR